ncbi:MAG: hypothetical protein WKF66_08960 [Pedobacter sp.]
MKKYTIIIFTLSILIAGCSKQHYSLNRHVSSEYQSLSVPDKQLADTLIKRVLDNEGLYTVISSLKPMSSASDLVLKIAQPDTAVAGVAKVTDVESPDYLKLERYQKVINALQFGDLKFIMLPFKMQSKGERILQINIYRQSLVDSLLTANAAFYGQFGYVPGASGQFVINTTEYEHKYDRFRSYGYLFGYPDHAVEFFVAASISNDKTGEFVKRDFYQIPVFSGTTGHFVYALSKGEKPTKVDELTKARAEYALLKYQNLRKKYLREDGTLRAYDLMLALLNDAGKK